MKDESNHIRSWCAQSKGISKDRKEAKRAKATRLAAVHVASESGIPADRGSFGA